MSLSATIPVGQDPGTISCTNDGSLAYVSNLKSNTVSVIDLAAKTCIQTIPVGAEPTGLAALDNGMLYVANLKDNTVSVIDVKKASTIKTGWIARLCRELEIKYRFRHRYENERSDRNDKGRQRTVRACDVCPGRKNR
jgi:YVTN family beta-propeller protein